MIAIRKCRKCGETFDVDTENELEINQTCCSNCIETSNRGSFTSSGNRSSSNKFASKAISHSERSGQYAKDWFSDDRSTVDMSQYRAKRIEDDALLRLILKK